MSANPVQVANVLLTARKGRRKLGTLPAAFAPTNEAEGIAAQFAVAEVFGAVPPAGFKVGATTRKMQDYLGLTAPIAGFMPALGVYQRNVELSFADFQAVGVECELAVTLAEDIAPHESDPAQVKKAIGAISTGIEIVENRYPPLKEFGTPGLIADQMFHAAAVIGAPDTEWDKLDLKAIKGSIFIDDAERGTGRGADLMGDPLAALVWLAGSSYAAAFGGLKAGQVILLGSVTDPVWLTAPAKIRVTFPPLSPVHLAFT